MFVDADNNLPAPDILRVTMDAVTDADDNAIDNVRVDILVGNYGRLWDGRLLPALEVVKTILEQLGSVR